VVLRLAGFLRRVGEEKSRHLVLVGAVDVNGDMTTRALDGHTSRANRPGQHAKNPSDVSARGGGGHSPRGGVWAQHLLNIQRGPCMGHGELAVRPRLGAAYCGKR